VVVLVMVCDDRVPPPSKSPVERGSRASVGTAHLSARWLPIDLPTPLPG